MKWTREGGAATLARLCLTTEATFLDALRAMEAGGQGIVFVCEDEGRVVGTQTDGDIRRALLAGAQLDSRTIGSAIRRDFASVTPQVGRDEVLDVMRARDIGQLPVLDANGKLVALHTVGALLSAAERTNWVVIMAGGKGVRLHPLTTTVPKPMLKVAGRPILERLVMHLMSTGLRNFYLSVNYLAEVIESHFGDGSRFGCRIEYLAETQPLGTGGALSLLPPMTEPVLVVNGDLVTQCDFGRMIDFHTTRGFAMTFGVKPYSVQVPFGVVSVDGDRVTDIREKPSHDMLINAGAYVLSPETLRLVPSGMDFPITQLFETCLRDGQPIGAYDINEEWIDVGEHEQLRRARGEA